MTRVEELLSISSEGLAARPRNLANIHEPFPLGLELFRMLECKNGFYAFESALHVFPMTSTAGMSLEEWNAETLWRNGYHDLAKGLLFFAEDVFQNQFCLAAEGVLRFDAETGATSLMADSIENWAKKILGDHRREVAGR